MDMNVSQLHEMNAGQCPTAALMVIYLFTCNGTSLISKIYSWDE